MAVTRNDVRVGESLMIGEIVVTLEKKSGQIARLSVDAPKDIGVKIIRDTREDTGLLE
ncbi:hypothetical protein ACRC7T_18130 [Segnochrobactraceae bacterium EtOH-i3]